MLIILLILITIEMNGIAEACDKHLIVNERMEDSTEIQFRGKVDIRFSYLMVPKWSKWQVYNFINVFLVKFNNESTLFYYYIILYYFLLFLF